ncbi:hypothetical protein FC83_GL003106 [Agrilactobacillus composti DSM 18527 = JCM 14202]|uniref:Surface layer protein A domain-containing protein n=1 Tax=Agrilactobacillus composti DSM 18527 = JCM 14202 TaxID=1423734 RepID=X0QJ42_9LACO|nr:hypothetical protein [Agrilactobacillus composti]KRM33033.1 hypothetical protein FC83_GL003106 [Agrilactobacillus composti DSM 18527 = JCM 14202]GAF38620.1 hypothetical protein JCM14202_441 [Agrilactobacillus composti DSM 18527 = JCM 14202]
MKKLLQFLSFGALLLGLSFILQQPQTVNAETMVAIPVEDSSFVTAGKGVTPTKADQLQPTGPVYGLSAWKIQATASLLSNRGSDLWNGATQAYKVGPDTWLADSQVLVIPQGKIVKTPANFIILPYDTSFTAGIVDNDGPVALWGSTDYTRQVGTVKPGSVWTITRYYAGSDGSIWFDLGNNQWIPSFYFNNNLFYQFNYAYNYPGINSDYMQQFRSHVELQHPIVVTVHGDKQVPTRLLPYSLSASIDLEPNSQWLSTNVYFGGGVWYQVGTNVWLQATSDSLD